MLRGAERLSLKGGNEGLTLVTYSISAITFEHTEPKGLLIHWVGGGEQQSGSWQTPLVMVLIPKVLVLKELILWYLILKS